MLKALQAVVAEADILVMAAAVADYMPESVATSKIHRGKEPLALKLQPNVDILQHLSPRQGLFRVGFAAETEDLAESARRKLEAKGLDMIVANQVGGQDQGLASDYNAVSILSPGQPPIEVPRAAKLEVAEKIWDAINAARKHRS
jgi:phosphopantothenoylcysteine decarboxylase/phosphopantothenate--cysteine ligase